MTIAPEEIEKLRELAKKATPGPWSAESRGNMHWIDHEKDECVLEIAERERDSYKYDAAFIAAARNALPALLSALEEEKAAREKAEEERDREQAQPWEVRCNYWKARADRLAKALEPFINGVRVSAGIPIKLVRCDVLQGQFDAARAALAEEPKETGNG